MEVTHELIEFNSNIPIKCSVQKIGHSKRHYHECIELLLILEGEVNTTIEDQFFHLNEDDVIVINNGEIHELNSDNSILISVQIRQDFLTNEFPDGTSFYFDCNSTTAESQDAFVYLRSLIAQLVKISANQPKNYALLMKTIAYRIITLLTSQFASSANNIKNTQSRKNMDRVAEIIRIVNENYNRELTLASLAEQLHLSVPYLSRFFDKHLGATFLQYLNSVRLSHAVNDLISTDASIEQIAADNGFSSAHSFVQIFKKNYDCLPSIYRRNHQGHGKHVSKIENASNFTSYKELNQSDYLSGLAKYLTNDLSPANENFGRISDKSIVIKNKGIKKELKHTWKNFLTVGSAKLILYAPIQKELREIQEIIGYKYIKFHGILSDEMQVYHVMNDGSVYYSFVLVDQVIDFLLSIHLKPFIQLSFMPRALALDPDKTCFGFITSPPKSISAWTDLVQATIEHLFLRYGSEVLDWPFAIWNEPDTNYNMFGFETYEAFYPFYKATYQTIKNINTRIQIGTPSNYYLTNIKSHWIVEFLTWCKENACMPDFINVHFYATTWVKPLAPDFATPEFTQKIYLTEDTDMFHTFVTQIKMIKKEMMPAGSPIYLTEWNVSPSHSDLLNDTCYIPCYIAKNILENYDELDSYGFWTLSDLTEESPIQPATFQGGLGMITHNGIKKPIWHTFYLLNQLGNELIDNGDGWFLTRSEKNYQLMLYNYKHYSPLYAQGEILEMTPTNRYVTFDPEEQIEVNITIKNMPSEEYRIVEHKINRKYGSAFDTWVEMGAVEPETKNELKILEGRSLPIINHFSARTEGGVLQLSVLLEQLEVCLLTMQPGK